MELNFDDFLNMINQGNVINNIKRAYGVHVSDEEEEEEEVVVPV